MRRTVLPALLALCPHVLLALGQARYVETTARPGSFALARAVIYVDSADHAGVVRAAGDLQADIERVTGLRPRIVNDEKDLGPNAIIIGTLGKSKALDRLITERKVDADAIKGKWESFFLQVVPKPFANVSNTLVIAGSDKRATIYGIYDLSEQIGVSPWYWWADVPVKHQDAIFVKPGRYLQGEPAVKYRGIFLNDEAPALSGWTFEKFGGWNSKFYVKVFELILRLRGNYLWPAMWGSAFNEDDPLNPKLADEYGIVMGNSHHEPMLRAQQEWKRHGKGPWNYNTNADVLRSFWEEGIKRNKDYESIISIGMRGDGDMPMAAADDMPANIRLLEKIVADQRKIITDFVNPDITKVPQLWALYKEVQEYYDRGMRVPDDVTLLWCDDNWGNIRRLPTPDERKRPGGAGIYYHFDYVGGPRNYKWLNTNPISKVWEQMNLALNYNATRIWIVNVGDLKPMEFPIEFFLSYAWNPQRWPHTRIAEFTEMWAAREFGPAHARDIADLMAKYTKYNGRRKPELLDSANFSLVDYQEADRILEEWQAITVKAESIYKVLPAESKDAFFQLILFPVRACYQVNEIYIAAAKNKLYAAQGRASANVLAARVRELFQADADWTKTYNQTLAGGKWNHMMDQTHIGYTYWQQPPDNNMPKVTELELPAEAKLGVAVEGSTSTGDGTLPAFDSFNRPRRYVDVFNRGKGPLEFSVSTGEPWLKVSKSKGTLTLEERLWITVDWAKAPAEKATGTITVTAGGDQVTVKVDVFNPRATVKGFVEADGVVSMEAEHYDRMTATPDARWEKVDDLGRTLSGLTIMPVTAPSLMPPDTAPTLEYGMYLFQPGDVEVHTIVSPTLNFVPGRGLRLALSVDNEPPQVADVLARNTNRDWEASVRDSARTVRTTHKIPQPGYHVLRVRMVDPAVVLQKIVVNLGGLKPSYLGPPESFRRQ